MRGHPRRARRAPPARPTLRPPASQRPLRAHRPAAAARSVAFLCTPTDIHVCTDASDAAARANYGMGLGSLGLEKLANVLSGGKFLVPNFSRPVAAADGKALKLVDGLSVAQGPNYALAKRMQHWRAQVEFEAGATVSSMVAPSTATISVIHNKTFAWAARRASSPAGREMHPRPRLRATVPHACLRAGVRRHAVLQVRDLQAGDPGVLPGAGHPG